MPLEDYKDIVGGAAGFFTFCQMFSGVFVCKTIYQDGSTCKTPATFFLGGCALTVLFFQHAILIKEKNMGIVNLGGIILHIAYLLFYYFWTGFDQRKHFLKNLSLTIFLILILLGYVQIENPDKVEFRFGIVVTTLLVFLTASPLFSLKTIIRTKSTEALPLPMIISGFLVSLHWLLYGIIIKNNFVIFQNFITFFLGCIQLSLFVIYPPKSKHKKLK